MRPTESAGASIAKQAANSGDMFAQDSVVSGILTATKHQDVALEPAIGKKLADEVFDVAEMAQLALLPVFKGTKQTPRIAGITAIKIKPSTLILKDLTVQQINQKVLKKSADVADILRSVAKKYSALDLEDLLGPGKVYARLYAELKGKGLSKKAITKKLIRQ